jgi:anti-anti-sigma factor
MKFDREELDWGALKVSLSGRMDITGVDAIAVPLAALSATESRRIVLDLSGVEFLASIGVRAILQNARAQHLRGGTLVLLSPTPLVEEVLRAAGVSHVVPIVADIHAARAALSA